MKGFGKNTTTNLGVSIFLCLICVASARDMLYTLPGSRVKNDVDWICDKVSNRPVASKNHVDAYFDVVFVVNRAEKNPELFTALKEAVSDNHLIDTVLNISPTKTRIGLGGYEYVDGVHRIEGYSPLVDDETAIKAAFDKLKTETVAAGQGNSLGALQAVSLYDFRPDAIKCVIWIGDSAPANNIGGIDRETVLMSLFSKDIHVFSLDLGDMDQKNDATIFAGATYGWSDKISTDDGAIAFQTVYEDKGDANLFGIGTAISVIIKSIPKGLCEIYKGTPKLSMG